MNVRRQGAIRGFSLVELLAVVLVLAVLAAIAVPLYLNTRKTSAARVCKGNIASLAAAETAYATRFGQWAADNSGGLSWTSAYATATATGSPPSGGLIGAPEGLTQIPTCPLKGASYTCVSAAVTTGTCEITCGDAAQHMTDTGAASTATWDVTLQPTGPDKSNPQ